MESVGQKLRDARLRRNLALEDVSAATKINLRNLQAIENDNTAQICSPFTYRSFARQFANFVHVDWTDLEQAVAETSGRMPTPLVPGDPGAPRPASRQRSKPKASKLRWALSFTSLILMLGLCSAFYAAWQTARTDVRGAVATFAKSFTPQASTEVHPARAVTAKAVNLTPTPEPAATNTPTPQAPPSFRIELSAVEKSWLSLSTDGKEVFSGILEPAQTKELDGQEEARIRTGNAGGVTVNFNGRSLGTLGRRGEVRTVIFNKNGYEVLESAARVRNSFPFTQTGE